MKVKRSRCEAASRRLPRLKGTADGQGLESHAGARLLAELAERLGIAAGLSGALAPIVKRPRRHAPGQVLVDLAVIAADGHELVSGLRVLRDQRGLFGEVAPQPTAWRLLDAIDESLLTGLQAARAASRAKVWAAGLPPVARLLRRDRRGPSPASCDGARPVPTPLPTTSNCSTLRSPSCLSRRRKRALRTG